MQRNKTKINSFFMNKLNYACIWRRFSNKLVLRSYLHFSFKPNCYISPLRKIASLPPDLATAGGLTARFPAVARSWCRLKQLKRLKRLKLLKLLLSLEGVIRQKRLLFERMTDNGERQIQMTCGPCHISMAGRDQKMQ